MSKLIEEYHPIKYEIYHVKDGKHSKEDITIYEDDSIQEIYYKIASREKKSFEYIHLWYFDDKKNYNLLGYKYEEIESLKDLYGLQEDEYVKECVDEDGTRIISSQNYNLHKTLENIHIKENRIYYTTLQDYISHIKLNPKEINSEKWSREIKYLQFINGKIRVYWPELTESLIIDQNNKKVTKKIKRVTKIVKNTDEILKKIYNFKDTLMPENIYINIFILENKMMNENPVNIAQIFTDIILKKYKDYDLLFSKIMMESYEDTYYKVLKTKIKDKNYPENPLSESDFNRLTKGTIISIPNIKVKYLDLRRSVSLVFNRDKLFIHLNVNDRGEIKLIIQTFIADSINHEKIIKDMNLFIEENIISQKIYFGLEDVKMITTDLNNVLKNSVNLINYDLEYNIKNFDIKVLEKMIDNLSIFFRIENIGDSKIHIIYKRVNEYNSIAGRLRMISKIVQGTEKKDEIISRISEIFNILDEDAIENYEIWKNMSNKGYKDVQEGVDIILEGFKSSHIGVCIGGCSSKREMIRINHLINTLMSCYYEYIEKKKDRLSLMKKKKIDEELLDFSDEDSEVHSTEVHSSEHTESTKADDTEDVNEEDSESSESMDMGLLDELDSDDDDESFGGYSNEMIGGGYDLRSYYLNRLTKNTKYDNELFKFTTGKNTTMTKKGEVKGTYARACSANYSRHPVALTEKELNEIKDNPEYGEGIGYSNAIKIEGRPTTVNGDIYYICPKYWDVKNETPLDPLKLDDFRDNVFGMDYSKSSSGEPVKTVAKDKANTEKYVMVRSGYHWTNAGDNIMRYKVESMKNVHPDGFDIPCCNVERLEKISKNDKIEWFDEKTKVWNRGVCVTVGSDKKPYIIKTKDKEKIKLPRNFLKRFKENNHISNAIPCNDGKYCHIHENLKIYIGQHPEMPKKGESDRGIYKIGLVRKGVKKNEDSLLGSLRELLKKKDIDALISDIIKDLHGFDNIYKVANGSFVNTFYSELKDIKKTDVKGFVKYLLLQKGVVKRHRDMLQRDDIQRENLFRGSPLMVSLNNHYYRLFSSIINYEKYLRDITDKEDKYITPVLCSIMNMNDNKTFGDKLVKTNIVVFEEINEDIRIREPIGGFKKDFDKIYLIYKYRGNYEPIFMNMFEEYVSLIDPDNINTTYEETIKSNKKINNVFESIHDFIKNIIENIKILLVDGKKKEYKQLPGALEIVEILVENNMPIFSQIYDDYGYIRYIETLNNCLVPVRPTSIESFSNYLTSNTKSWILNYPSSLNLKYVMNITSRPTYKNVDDILKIIDKQINKELYLGYLDKINVNVIEYYDEVKIKDKTISKHGYYIKEIVVNETSFIPVEKTLYKKQSHHDILYKGELYEIDSYISKNTEIVDKMKGSLIMKNYRDELINLISRKFYILYLQKVQLQKDIENIKSVRFMKNYHKIKKLHNLIDKHIRSFCVFKDEEYYEDLKITNNDRINIYHTDKYTNEIIYYKILMKISSLFHNYSKKDYNYFVGGYINDEIMSKSTHENELCFNYNDIEMNEHKYLFLNKSIFIRNTNIYNDCISLEYFEKIKKLRNINETTVDFEKKYPKIINEYIHKNSLVLRYGDKESKYSIVQRGFEDDTKISVDELKIMIDRIIEKNEKRKWIYDEKEMNVIELFREFLGNEINKKEDIMELIKHNQLTIPEAYILSYIFKKGINMIIYNKDNTVELMIIITPQSINSSLGETELISLIQTNKYLGNISIRNELIFPLDSYGKKYYSVLRKKYRRIYDNLEELKKLKKLKANTTPIKK
jgi:hypothetical protein